MVNIIKNNYAWLFVFVRQQKSYCLLVIFVVISSSLFHESFSFLWPWSCPALSFYGWVQAAHALPLQSQSPLFHVILPPGHI